MGSSNLNWFSLSKVSQAEWDALTFRSYRISVQTIAELHVNKDGQRCLLDWSNQTDVSKGTRHTSDVSCIIGYRGGFKEKVLPLNMVSSCGLLFLTEDISKSKYRLSSELNVKSTTPIKSSILYMAKFKTLWYILLKQIIIMLDDI